MNKILEKLNQNNKLPQQKEFVYNNICYEGITGSVSYGINNSESDVDVASITIPPMNYIFPYNSGYGKIYGLDKNIPSFECLQLHNISYNEEKYDILIYGITKFFQLAIDNNPNICDILFLPDKCITYIDSVGQILRSNRHLFLSKNSYPRFMGYACSQLKKLKTKNKQSKSNLIEKYDYDLKSASHVVRLLLETEQILIEHDLDLEKNSEFLKSIRDGFWKLDEIEKWVKYKEKNMNKLHTESTLRQQPDLYKIKEILIQCIKEKHGSTEEFSNISYAVDDSETEQ